MSALITTLTSLYKTGASADKRPHRFNILHIARAHRQVMTQGSGCNQVINFLVARLHTQPTPEFGNRWHYRQDGVSKLQLHQSQPLSEFCGKFGCRGALLFEARYDTPRTALSTNAMNCALASCGRQADGDWEILIWISIH